MTTSLQSNYRTRRVYEVRPSEAGRELRLSDRVVELGEREFGWYQRVADWLPSVQGVAELSRDLGLDEARVPRLFQTLEESGLLYRVDAGAKSMTGLEFHERFSTVLNSWLTEAFSHPFWERMTSGRGSARLFTRLARSSSTTTRGTRTATCRSPARTRPREGDQAAARQALRRGVEPLPLLHEVAEGARLRRDADRRHRCRCR